jgi:predicted ester cyclase
MITKETENKAKARQIPEGILTEGNLDLADELFADDYVGRFLSEPHHGPEGVKEYASIVQNAFSDIEATVEDVIAEDDKVVRRDRLTGTHDGEFMGIEPTGEDVEITGIVILRVEDGQFVESWGQANTYELMQQLGVVEAPGE